MKFHLIIPSAGSGTRFNSKIPKQFVKINGKEILLHTIEKFSCIENIFSITLSVNKDSMSKVNRILMKSDTAIPIYVIEGGNTRQKSVKNAFDSIEFEKGDYVIIHDAARPFISVTKIRELMEDAKKYGSALPCLKINDTIKSVIKGYVKETVSRDNLYTAQTPQIFRCDILKKSYEKISNQKINFTDESAIVENAGFKVHVSKGEDSNIKITNQKDIKYFKFI